MQSFLARALALVLRESIAYTGEEGLGRMLGEFEYQYLAHLRGNME